MITRYLYAYGPATPQQFAQWIGAPPVWAGEQFERHPETHQINFDGISTWVVGGDAEVPTETDVKGSVLLLRRSTPTSSEATRVTGSSRERRPADLAASGQAGNYRSCPVDGVVGGVWHQRRTGRSIDVTVEPLATLPISGKRLRPRLSESGRSLESGTRLTVRSVPPVDTPGDAAGSVVNSADLGSAGAP